MPYAVAADIGATHTMLALVDISGRKVIAHRRPMTDVVFTGRRPSGLALADAFERFLRDESLSIDEIVGAAAGVPGTADRATGSVRSCPNLHVLDDAPLGPDASEALDLPVYVDNNTNLISLGEHVAGLGRETRDMAVVFVGSGVGCGLILDGHLYEGADGVAAEFGHTIVVANGLQCTCGAHGCLEMYCSGKALARVADDLFDPRELFALGSRFAGTRLLIEQANNGHSKAREALRQSFAYLGLGLTSLVNLLNPSLVVLGGGVISGWPEGLNVARETVMQEALPAARKNLRIEVSQLGNYAGVLGGAALVEAQGDISRI